MTAHTGIFELWSKCPMLRSGTDLNVPVFWPQMLWLLLTSNVIPEPVVFRLFH